MDGTVMCIFMIALVVGIGIYEMWYTHSDHVQSPVMGKLDPWATVVSIHGKKPSRKSNYIKTTITFSDGFVFVACDTKYGPGTLIVTPDMKSSMLRRARAAHDAAVEKSSRPNTVSTTEKNTAVSQRVSAQKNVQWHSLSENLLDLGSENVPSVPPQESTSSIEKQSEPSLVAITLHRPSSVEPVPPNTSYPQGPQTIKKSKKRGNSGFITAILVVLALICTIGIVNVCIRAREHAEQEARIQSVEDAIGALGAISPDSLPAIEAAEAKLDSLTQEERDRVANLTVLSDARKEYQRLDEKLRAVDAALNVVKIPITVEDKNAIERARAAFDALEEDNLSGYRAEEKKTLSGYEKEWTKAYANSLLDTGKALCEQGKYQDALATYYDAMDNYYFVSAKAKEGAITTLESWLLECYEAKDYEAMYDLLQESKQRGFAYSSDSLMKIAEKLNKKLDALRPRNGKVLKKNINWGYCEFEVTAGSQDVCFKLESRDDPETYAIVYVRESETASIKVKDGSYIMKYTQGDAWFGDEKMFGKDAQFGKVDEVVSFKTTRNGSWVRYSKKYIVLSDHSIGEIGIPAISRSEW